MCGRFMGNSSISVMKLRRTSVHWSEVLLSKLGGCFALAICHLFGDPFLLLHFIVVQSLSCLTLCEPMDCSIPSSFVLQSLPESAQVHVYCAGDAIQPSHPLAVPFSFCPHSFPASGSFPGSGLFTSGGQSIGASASAYHV